MKTRVITNHHTHQLKYEWEVPKKVLKDFDHLSDDEKGYGWIHYRSVWYHETDFMRVFGNNEHFEGWDGYVSDSFFSGVLIKFSEDQEYYKIGTYLS